MNCPKCQTQNEDNAQFCKNCGTNMHYFQEPSNNSKTSDLLILIFLIFMFVKETSYFAIVKLVDYWYEGSVKYLLIGMNLIFGISLILLVLSIRNKTSKIFGIIIASLYAIFVIYVNINWLLGY